MGICIYDVCPGGGSKTLRRGVNEQSVPSKETTCFLSSRASKPNQTKPNHDSMTLTTTLDRVIVCQLLTVRIASNVEQTGTICSLTVPPPPNTHTLTRSPTSLWSFSAVVFRRGNGTVSSLLFRATRGRRGRGTANVCLAIGWLYMRFLLFSSWTLFLFASIDAAVVVDAFLSHRSTWSTRVLAHLLTIHNGATNCPL